MIDFFKEEIRFKNVVLKFEDDLKLLRAGRATSALVENVRVEAYGVITPLSHLAALSTPDHKSILVEPWDKSLMPAIEQGVRKSNTGLGIVSDKEKIRLTLPLLSDERRKELVKFLKQKMEEARISIRKIRDDIWKTVQEEEKAKLISENQKFSQKEKMEKMVMEFNKKIEEIAAKKEKEITEG